MKAIALSCMLVLSTTVQAGDFDLLTHQGRYVNILYLRMLQETRSPALAADSAYLVTYELKSTDSAFAPEEENFYLLSRAKDYPGRCAFYTRYYFHESDMGVILALEPSEDGFQAVRRTDERYATDRQFLKFCYANKDTFLILKVTRGDGKPMRLDTLKKEQTPIEQLVNRLVIAGSYQSNTGDLVVFQEAGDGSWVGKSFLFRFELDSFWSSTTLIEFHGNGTFPVNGKILGLVATGDNIELYRMKHNEGGIFTRASNAPIITLRKIRAVH